MANTTQHIVCGSCGVLTDPTKLRLRATSANIVRQCNKCNCKTVQLSRIFGSWPPPNACEIPADELQAFFKDIHGLNPKETKAKYDARLSRFTTSEEYFAFEGEYLPLGVWSQRGFDGDRTDRLHVLPSSPSRCVRHAACCL